jgi:hypothetical protein
MALTNAERQARWRKRQKDRLAALESVVTCIDLYPELRTRHDGIVKIKWMTRDEIAALYPDPRSP